MFPDQKVSSSQMKTALNGVVRKLGLSEFIVENLLCKALRPKQGFDTFHQLQSITFLEKEMDNILCVSSDGNVESRSVDDDCKSIEKLPCMDRVVPIYQWWQAKMRMEGIHEWFVTLCRERNIDPKSLIICPHLNAKVLLNKKRIWEQYIW